jgi:FAD/FMN-containing dehydrogenase
MAVEWINWGGNQRFDAAEIVRPPGEHELIAAAQGALAAGHPLRAAGSGHSFSPVVDSDHTLLDLSRVSGVLAADARTLRATALAGTVLGDLGAPFWEAGVALANQGDIDTQTLAGAVATATKGSGRDYGSISSMVRGARLVTGTGDVIDVGEGDVELLRAAQVSIGMLGVMTRVELEVVPRYRLVEENRVMPFEQLTEEWDDLLGRYRHFSFWWCPTDRSSAMYGLAPVPAGHALVKLLREPGPGEPDVLGVRDGRTDRSHRIYPDVATDAYFHELEYMIAAERARPAVDAVRSLQLTRFPDEISPLQVRWQKADDGLISPQSGRETVSISVSGAIGTDYEPFLRAVDATLEPFDARPHWGKIHFLDAPRVRELYPELDTFLRIRAELDPHGLFLNDHLRELFAP